MAGMDSGDGHFLSAPLKFSQIIFSITALSPNPFHPRDFQIKKYNPKILIILSSLSGDPSYQERTLDLHRLKDLRRMEEGVVDNMDFSYSSHYIVPPTAGC